ncbi:MAG: hypothetical protein HY401_09135 [Elusimicrobia bacterium]|nr:hypothetical protein [Elusimicrobiota bacterium]
MLENSVKSAPSNPAPGSARVVPKPGYEGVVGNLKNFENLYYRAEWEMTRLGFRRLAVIHVNPETYDEQMVRIKSDGLLFTPVRKIVRFQGFIRGHASPRGDETYCWYGGLTRAAEDGQLFREAEEKSDHKIIGQLLGYPDCCVDYFCRYAGSHADPLWVNHAGDVQGYAECNILLRSFGLGIAYYWNCAPDCANAQKTNERWYQVMRGIDSRLAESLKELLRAPVTWSSHRGVVEVDTPYFTGQAKSLAFLEEPRTFQWRCKQ